MLAGLLLSNFAIAKKIELSFDSNLIVITGETGAGKTVIMKALSAACGGTVSSDVIRSGAEKAQAEASFTLDNANKAKEIIKEYDLLDDQSVVILTRTIYKNRTKGGVNGHFVPIKILEKIGRSLIDMHGQHEMQSLLDYSNHIHILDRFGGDKLLELKYRVYDEVQKLKSLDKEIYKLEEENRKYREEREFIDFEIKELEDADLREGEEEELRKEELLLSNAQELSNLISQSRYLLSQGETSSIIDQLDELLSNMEKASSIDSKFSNLTETIEAIRSELSDIDRELSAFSDENLFDPQRLNEVEERLSFISTLKMKYRKSVSELIAYLEELKSKSYSFSTLADKIDKLKKEKSLLLSKLKADTIELSKMRKRVSELFRNKVLAELRDLAMENADFKVDISYVDDPNGIEFNGKRLKLFPYGIDTVKFIIAPNPGEGFKDLTSIASGGELSRVMLAIKRVIAAVDEIPTLAFDEVDAGIGGKTGEKVAEKLLEISKFRQVICITHLPQIASLPGEHIVVEKVVKNNDTFLTAKKLNEEERVREIARMISGSNITETTLKQARELLRRWVA